MNMAFAPKFSTKKFPLQIFHEKFFSTKIFPPVYSYPEYLSFAQFTWFSFSFSSIVFFRLALLWSCFSFSSIDNVIDRSMTISPNTIDKAFCFFIYLQVRLSIVLFFTNPPALVRMFVMFFCLEALPHFFAIRLSTVRKCDFRLRQVDTAIS